MQVFDSSWRRKCSVRKCSITEVDAFIFAHYLAKRPAIVLLCLVAERDNLPIGCIVYSAPPREADKRYGGKTWELARLYLLDEIPKNAETWLIGQSVKYIKKNHKDVAHLLSYADPSSGHSGTIYRAANWRADGRTDDERKTPRCDYYDKRTGKKYGRRGNMPIDTVVQRRPRVSKYRFTLDLKQSQIRGETMTEKIPPKPCPKQGGADISHEGCGRIKAQNLCNRECEQPEKKPVPVQGIPGNLFDPEVRN